MHVASGARGVVELGPAGLVEGPRLHVEVPPALGQALLGREGNRPAGELRPVGEAVVGHVEVLLLGARAVAPLGPHGPQLGLHLGAEPLRTVEAGVSLVVHRPGPVEAHLAGPVEAHGAHLVLGPVETHLGPLLEAHGPGAAAAARSHAVEPLRPVKVRHGPLPVEPPLGVRTHGAVKAAGPLRTRRPVEPPHALPSSPSSHRAVGAGRAVVATLSVKPLPHVVRQGPPALEAAVVTAGLVVAPGVVVATRSRGPVVAPRRVGAGGLGPGGALHRAVVPRGVVAPVVGRRVSRGGGVLAGHGEGSTRGEGLQDGPGGRGRVAGEVGGGRVQEERPVVRVHAVGALEAGYGARPHRLRLGEGREALALERRSREGPRRCLGPRRAGAVPEDHRGGGGEALRPAGVQVGGELPGGGVVAALVLFPLPLGERGVPLSLAYNDKVNKD